MVVGCKGQACDAVMHLRETVRDIETKPCAIDSTVDSTKKSPRVLDGQTDLGKSGEKPGFYRVFGPD